VNDEPPPVKVLRLRGQLLELGAVVRQLHQAGLDSAAASCCCRASAPNWKTLSREAAAMSHEPLQWYDDKADNTPWIKALAEVRTRASREGWCYQHVQAIIVAIDQYAEKALGNREFFLNKPYGIGGVRRRGDVP
jgi:hypothetical protein